MAVTTQQDKKYVAFKLGNEFYAIDVQQVQEVFIPSSITAIPQAGQHVAGVINYRGAILTVILLVNSRSMNSIILLARTSASPTKTSAVFLSL